MTKEMSAVLRQAIGSHGHGWSLWSVMVVLGIIASGNALAQPGEVTASLEADRVEVYDFAEVVLRMDPPPPGNPFTEVEVRGEFGQAGGPARVVEGFCDSADGSEYRIRFMPTVRGEHTYHINIRAGGEEWAFEGRFEAVDARRRGLVRVDPEHPWHFMWEGTGEHYFYNGTTAYFLAGWDEETIRSNLDRLARLKVSRVRSALAGRVHDGQAWFENVYPTDRFSFCLNPWVAARPEDVEDPGFDVTRFNVEYWRKWDELLRHARDLDVVISVIFYVDGARPGVYPFGDDPAGADEQRYYRYAIARLAPYSNVMWDVTNEYQLFRDEGWAERMGALIEETDPYGHLTSIHGHGDFPFRTSPWADFAMYQAWDESGGYRFMLSHRERQAATGRPMPQVNEEYGYEDHYPAWGGGRQAPTRAADNRRRLAWEIAMAGGYQTGGERADTGTGWGPDTGGGWINGRGDDSMVLFRGYGHMVDFFTSLPWWTLEPDSSFYTTEKRGAVVTDLSHVAYTRDSDGATRLYVDGELVAEGAAPGALANWDPSMRLGLGNEMTRDRAWLGELHGVAIYDRALSADDVAEAARSGEPTPGAVVAYDFSEGAGDVIRDTSGEGASLDLRVEDPEAVEWLPGGGLRINEDALIASEGPATKLIDAVTASGEMSLQAWVSPANTTQAGPARIVTLSRDTGQRNFTLGQGEAAYEVRFRTQNTSANGEPSLWSPGSSTGGLSVMGLRHPEGELAVVYLARGGAVWLDPDAVAGEDLARWYNPRTGDWSPAEPEDGSYVAPDDEDWVLVVQ
jgi:hypothetical protein